MPAHDAPALRPGHFQDRMTNRRNKPLREQFAVLVAMGMAGTGLVLQGETPSNTSIYNCTDLQNMNTSLSGIYVLKLSQKNKSSFSKIFLS